MAILTRDPSTHSDYNCSWALDPEDIEPNGDVSGPGVLAGFLGPAYFVVLVIMGYYLLCFEPNRNPFQFRLEEEGLGRREDPWRINPIDEQILSVLRSRVLRFKQWQPTRDRIKWHLEDRFKKCILNFCDLQIITGFGILVSGFYCLEDVSAYHWQIIVYLAWFANITHITTLTFLRDYLHSRKDLQERNFRTFTMLVFLLLLLAAEFPTGFFNWLNEESQFARASSYAKCFFSVRIVKQRFNENYPGSSLPLQDTTAFQSMIISMVLLVFNFGSRVVKLSMTLSSIFNHKVRVSLSQWFKALILRSVSSRRKPAPPHWPENRRTYIITKPLMALFLLARLYLDLGTSTLAEVYWLIVSTIWGSFHLFSAKNSGKVDDGSITFGQVLPVVLLIAPLLPIVIAVVQLSRDALSNPLESSHGVDEVRASTVNVNSARARPGPSPVRESQPQWLTQSYYHKAWMKPAIAVAVGQVLYLTITIFQLLASNISAVKTLIAMLIWIFYVQPASCFFIILFGLAVGTHAPHHRPRCHLSPTYMSCVYWLFAVIIFVLYPMVAAWIGWFSPAIVPWGVSLSMLLTNVPIAPGLMFLYCIACCLIIRSPANADEEQIEIHTD